MAVTTVLPPKRFSLESIRDEGFGLPSKVIFYGVPGIGKCLGKGTPVIMFDGTIKPVEEVQEGDMLMGPDSTPRHVHGLCRGYGPLYRVSQKKSDSYVVNERHVLSLKKSSRAGRDSHHSVFNISVLDYLKTSNATKQRSKGWRPGSIAWPEQHLPLDPYLLGCWLGDGTASKPDITTPEPEVLCAMSEYAESVGVRVAVAADCGKASTFRISGPNCGGVTANPFTSSLKLIGVLNNKHIPHAYKTSSREQRLELLAGLLDSDGYLACRCFEIITKRQCLADDIVFLARSLGFCTTVRPCEKSCIYKGERRAGIYWRIFISGDVSEIPNRVPRKKATARKQVKDVLVNGITVEPIGDGEFFGFELDQDHLFLLGDFTVTHNSSWAGHAPSPVFVMSELERGILGLKDANLVPKNCKVFPDQIKTWPDIFLAIDTLENTNHDRKTVVFDVVNGLERTCHEMVCMRDFKNSMATFKSWEQGAKVSVNDFKQFLIALDRLQEKRQMMIILLAHCKVAPHKHPDGAYDRWVPNMYSETWSLVHGWADAVLFANYLTVVKDSKGYGGTDRLIHTQHTAAWDAKSKGLPPAISMGESAKTAWDNFAEAMQQAKTKAKANNNGSTN